MESYVTEKDLVSNEENATHEFFALGNSRYFATYELRDNNYLVYSYIKCRPAFILDYRNDFLIAPRNRALNPLLRQYAEREELEFKHGRIGEVRGSAVSVIKLKNPPTVNDSDLFEGLELKEKIPKTLNEYVNWVVNYGSWDLSGYATEIDSPEQAIQNASQTVTIPSVEQVEVRNIELNICPDPNCPACNPEVRQALLNRQRQLQEEYVRASLQSRETTFGSSTFVETVDDLPF